MRHSARIASEVCIPLHPSYSRCGMIIMLAIFVMSVPAHGQTLVIYDIDATAFPLMKAKFFAFDASGAQITALSPSDFQVRENGIVRVVTHVSCPPVNPPVALSSVLTIDISGSMARERLAMAQTAARAWIEALILGPSECAVTSFNNSSYLNQDFTIDRSALLNVVTSLQASDGTNYTAALLTPPAGALEVTKHARSKRIVVFLSDGQCSMPRENDILNEALRQKVTIFGVMLGMKVPQHVKNICTGTGGQWFENVTTATEAEEIYRRILQTAQGGDPCTLEWISDGCDRDRSLEVTLPGIGAMATAMYHLPEESLSQLAYSPSRSLHFGEVQPGTLPQQQVTITARFGEIRIDRITPSNLLFRIIDYGGAVPPFTLTAGQSRTLTVEYAPVDSNKKYCRFTIAGNACLGMTMYADAGWPGKKDTTVRIKVIRPNGGEQFIVGGDEDLVWDGVMPEEKVRLEYSTDAGATWLPIEEEAIGLKYAWKTADTPSDVCLLRATADARTLYIGDMVLIPAGSFRMGNITNHPDGLIEEKPVHQVTISRPFLMGRTEVTQAQYEFVMFGNPSQFPGLDRPVERVNWYDAVAFCNELSRQDGFTPCYSGSGADIVCDFTASGYRLPTEAEWEYACRGGTSTDFYTGNLTHPQSSPVDPALDNAGWYSGNAASATHQVAQKAPNAFGLYDMHGNVYEWCWDWFELNYYSYGDAQDPLGPNSGSYRVLRGSGWNDLAWTCRSAFRYYGLPETRTNSIGFRLVRRQ